VAPFDEFRSPVATARFLRRLVRERGVDVIHTFHNKAYKGAILARVLTGGGFRLFLNRGVIFKPNALVGLWARLASGMVANSFCCSEVLQCHLAPKGRISVVYNALDMSGIPARDPGARARRGLRFAWVGNAAPVKGPDVFFRAVEAYCGGGDVRDVEFTVCGVDDASPFLPLAGGAAGRIHNTGTLPHPRILEQMAAADVFVSSSRLESMPNTLLEAFALSLPVVATDVGGVSELVAHEVNGLLVPEGDHEALARAMRELADDFETRVRMGRVNRRLAERLFCPQRKGRNLVRTYMGETVRERPDIRALLEEVADE
jgi:glycosyltransferase involved in cell wall biosynthesis